MKLTVTVCFAALLASACSQADHYPTGPSAATGAAVQAIATNAPNGAFPDVVTVPGISDPSAPPIVRVESSYTHIDFKWNRNANARYIEFSMKRRDDNRPASVVKPDAGTLYTEVVFESGIYDGSVVWVYPDGNRSQPYTFQLNHGKCSLCGPPTPLNPVG